MNQSDSKTQSICLVQKTFSLKEEQITSQSILDREYLLAESTDSFYFFFFFLNSGSKLASASYRKSVNRFR